ncbi:MAG TPA: molybdopterin cofactor-binding domain-containing protein [Kofleriaceae bacterium]|jgi:isoquinoline 1-oxidoreductase beta subunit
MTIVVSRRAFVLGIGAASAGLALGMERRAAAGPVKPSARVFAPDPFIQIGADGTISIVCHRSEMGQGIRSSLPVLIADELGADPDAIAIVQGDGDARYGDQDTDGSASVRGSYEHLRQLAATARTMLITAAARRWHVPEARLVARDGAVWDGKRELTFGELAEAAATLPVPTKVKLGTLRYVGKELPARDAPDQVVGRAVYAADVRLPDMLVAVVARPPVLFGKPAKVDAKRALAVPGVKQVVELPALAPPVKYQALGGVAVIGEHTWAALRGRAALAITWDDGENASYDSRAYRDQLLAAVRAPGDVVRSVGDAEAALAAAARKVEAEYIVPHLAHAPMEPPAAIARVDGNRVEVWACTQSPQDMAEAIADALGVAKHDVTVHVTLLGGGFGRKSFPDFAIEAARLAKQAGVPVRVQWTREDDLRHSTYHTHSAQALAAGLDAAGEVVAWRHRIAYPSISSTFDVTKDHPSNGELSQGVFDLPLAVPAVSVQTGAAKAHTRIGWLRSVCNIQQAFAVQSFIDELAHATNRDPRDMLVRVLGPARVLDQATQGTPVLSNYGEPLDRNPIDVGRLHAVIEKATAMAGWDKREGRALGVAAHHSFVSYVAVVAHVSKGARGEPRLEEAWIAADVGTAINPERVRYQMEGAFVFAASNALHGAITYERGAVVQSNYRDYRMLRMPEAPRAIHVELVRSGMPPGGAGEPGVPPVAPAIANAWFALTGTRVRELPFLPTPRG